MGHAGTAAEILSPVVGVIAAGYVGIADADITVIGAQDVCTVSVAVHPGGDDGLRARVAGGDVLAARYVVISGIENPLVKCPAILAGVAEVIVIAHVLGVQPCRNGQRLTVGKGSDIVGRAFDVYKFDNSRGEVSSGVNGEKEQKREDDSTEDSFMNHGVYPEHD